MSIALFQMETIITTDNINKYTLHEKKPDDDVEGVSIVILVQTNAVVVNLYFFSVLGSST